MPVLRHPPHPKPIRNSPDPPHASCFFTADPHTEQLAMSYISLVVATASLLVDVVHTGRKVMYAGDIRIRGRATRWYD